MKLLFALVTLIPSLVTAQEQDNEKVIDGKFILAAGSLAAATVFDAEATFAGIGNGSAHEGNSLLSPLVKSGRPATYAVLGGLDAGIMYGAYRMRKSPDRLGRKIWWVGPVAATAVHAFCGGFNLRFTFR